MAWLEGLWGQPQSQGLRAGGPQMEWLGFIVAVHVLDITFSF